jgi:hypothetical protein
MAHTTVTTTELTYAGRTLGVATVTISRVGQDSPAVGDTVSVQVELELPASSAAAPQTLHPELQFGSRVVVFGCELLGGSWSTVAGKVARTAAYTGTDYIVLFASADAYATTELGKLTAALAAREAARVLAG